MVKTEEINAALDKMILSASGWRGIFAHDGEEESTSEKISNALRVISGAAAFVFAEYILSKLEVRQLPPTILLAADTRPTGKAIADAMLPVLLAAGCDVRYAGITSAPEIMAWVRNVELAEGFIYISASHNPIGYNGIKFGLKDGGVLEADEAEKLITQFNDFLKREDNAEKIERLFSAADKEQLEKVYANTTIAKADALKTYHEFCGEVVCGNASDLLSALREGLEKNPLGVVCDFNGSARTTSVDKDFFADFNINFESINSEPGQIVHRIVPEGQSLDYCAKLLEDAHTRNNAFVLGYMPDCDGDRGNLVIWDETINSARALEAQEVFALACIAEFAHLVWTGNLSCSLPCNLQDKTKAAVAVNDPTSMRIDRIAESFGIKVFRAEVGEANVVSLARRLRKDGYIVRILGEGSAGGNITHPSSVRDPISTVFAIVKLLSIRSKENKPGLFEIWCKLSGQTELYNPDFLLADIIANIIASIPRFVTTPAYSHNAVLRIKTKDHAALKDRYQQIFLREWERRKDELKEKFQIYDWEAIAYNKTIEKRKLNRFGEAGKGGLKVLFKNDKGAEIAYIWMRGSATEPVFRIMADVEGTDNGYENYLLNWQQNMIIEADG